LHDESTPEALAGHPLRRLHLLYHEVTLRRSEYSYAIEREQFERHLDLFVHMRKHETFGLWPELTFDDGHISNFEMALPALQSRALVARFFITAGWTGNKPGYMGWTELRSLHASGQSIGAHGWSHTLLTHCAKKELDKELSGARLLLEDKLGTSVTTMSLPGGRYNQRVLAACREAGYSRIYTSEPSAEQVPTGYIVGRLNIRGDMTLEWIQRLFQPGSPVLLNLERQYRLKVAAKRLLGDRLYEKFWAVLNRKDPGTGDGGGNAA
jgi:peptidoglycan/xylan/chitin deacetylase (PgdA/CDA1 family)